MSVTLPRKEPREMISRTQGTMPSVPASRVDSGEIQPAGSDQR